MATMRVEQLLHLARIRISQAENLLAGHDDTMDARRLFDQMSTVMESIKEFAHKDEESAETKDNKEFMDIENKFDNLLSLGCVIKRMREEVAEVVKEQDELARVAQEEKEMAREAFYQEMLANPPGECYRSSAAK
jgi:hypothetical protein